MKIHNMKNQPEKTLELYEQMIKENIPANEMTYLLLINAASQIAIQTFSQRLIQRIPLKMLEKRNIQNALIDMWVK